MLTFDGLRFFVLRFRVSCTLFVLVFLRTNFRALYFWYNFALVNFRAMQISDDLARINFRAKGILKFFFKVLKGKTNGKEADHLAVRA